jgi:hypothetical protein
VSDLEINDQHVRTDEEMPLQGSRARQTEVKVEVEQRPDFFHLSLGLSLNLLESWRAFSASC